MDKLKRLEELRARLRKADAQDRADHEDWHEYRRARDAINGRVVNITTDQRFYDLNRFLNDRTSIRLAGTLYGACEINRKDGFIEIVLLDFPDGSDGYQTIITIDRFGTVKGQLCNDSRIVKSHSPEATLNDILRSILY